MAQKTLILYDLKGKSSVERTQIQRKLYGYKDSSNYGYSYNRAGMLSRISHEKYKKIALKIDNKKDVKKIAELLKELKVNFDMVMVEM
jgi:hypothetical protein